MKFKTAKIQLGSLNSDFNNKSSVIFMPPSPEKSFGQTLVRGSEGIEETYILISKDLIFKSTRLIVA